MPPHIGKFSGNMNIDWMMLLTKDEQSADFDSHICARRTTYYIILSWTSGLSHGTLYAPSQRHWKVFESNTKTNLQYLKVGFNPSEGRYAAELLWHDCPIPQEKKATYLSILIEIVPKWFVVHCPLQKYCLWRRNKGLMWHLWSSQDLCKRLMDNYELLLRGGFVLRHEKENTQLIFNLMKAFCENVLQGTVCHGATMLSFIFNFTLHM